MDYFSRHFQLGNEISLFYDVGNYLFYCLLFLLIFKKKKNNINEILLLLSTPFFFNNSIFNWWTFPDQSKYFALSHNFRNFDWSFSQESLSIQSISVYTSGFLYSFLTFPFIETYKSIAFLNRFLFVSTVYFLFEKKKLDLLSKNYLLFSPTIILYTSLSLRESLIIIFFFLFIYFLYKQKNISLIFGSIFILLKKFYFPLIILFYYICLYNFLIKISKNKNLLRKKLLFINIILALALIYLNYKFNLIENLRLGFFVENDSGYQNILSKYSYINMKEYFWGFKYIDGLLKSLTVPIHNLNIKSIVFFIDGLILLFLVLKIIFLSPKIDNFIKFFLILFLFSFLSLSGTVIFNDHTLLRYKVVFLISLLLGLNLIYKKK